MTANPPPPASVAELEDHLSRPSVRAVNALRQLDGDLLILGVGGKMGPTLARMAIRADREAGRSRRVFGVSRFTSSEVRDQLAADGVETISADLLDEAAWNELPDAANVLIMTGLKFGTAQQPSLTWAMNCLLPALACRRYRQSRLVAFSTGNVYGYTTPASGGSQETDALAPVGEYAMAALGRERIFDYFSRRHVTPLALLRLNYACELRYGVLVDIARCVWQEDPLDVSMGHVNVIWQAEASAMALAAFAHVASPPRVMNVAGPEILRIREVAEQFGRLFGKKPILVGEEAPTALLNNGRGGWEPLGRPEVSAEQMIRWIADWVAADGEHWDRPTHFQTRSGAF